MSKLRSVIRHEYFTIIKQPSFWIAMISVPVIIAIVFTISTISQNSSEERIQEIAKDLKNVAIVDNSGLLNQQVISQSGLKLSPNDKTNTLREKVRSENIEALVVFPENLKQTREYNIYLSSNDFTKMSSVSSLADNLLKTSLFLPLGSAEVITLAQNGAQSTVSMYKNGELTGGFNDYIVPGAFLVLFYIVFMFSVGYMLTSISEEKENRSMEMVLTYVKTRTLIVGKLLAVSLVTLTQVGFFALLGLIALLIFTQINGVVALPLGIDFANLTLDPSAIFFGASFLIVGFLMYAGFMTTAAAAAPSTKEAANFSSVFYIGAFVPFYFINLIMTDPQNSIVQFLTYFPLTSPVVALLRNTLDTIGFAQSWLVLGVMSICMVFSIWLAIRAFRLGALEYSQTIKFSKLFRKN